MDYLELIADVLGTSAGSLSELIESDNDEKSAENLKKHFNSVIQKKIDKAKRLGKDEALGQAKRTALDKAESELAEKYGVDKKELPDLVESIVEKNREKIKSNPDDIRNSDVYLEDIKKVKDEYKKLEDSFDQFKTNQKKEKVHSSVQQSARSLLQEKFALPEDKKKRSRMVDLFLNDLLGSDVSFDLDDDGKVKVLDSNGNPLRTEMMDEIELDKLVEKRASEIFDPKQDCGRQSPNNRNNGGGGAGSGGEDFEIPSFTTSEEFVNILNDTEDPSEIEALNKAYESKVEAGELQD